jgi:hypothetical protein
MILWLFKMSRTSEDIDPTATNDKLPIMPSDGRGSSDNNTDRDLKEFVKILLGFNVCSRNYCERTKQLRLVYYDKKHTGCRVTINLIRYIITIRVFIHCDTLEVADHTFYSSGFRKYVMPFLTPTELEKQKRFDELELEQQRLIAEQQKLRELQEKTRNEALKNAHQLKPRQCGGVRKCKQCEDEERILIHNQEIQHMITSEKEHGPQWRSIVGPGYT